MKLLGWEDSNRIQFSVPKERVGVATDVVPILFRLSSATGYSKTDLTFVFDYMSVAGSSYANRKKVALGIGCDLKMDERNKLSLKVQHFSMRDGKNSNGADARRYQGFNFLTSFYHTF